MLSRELLRAIRQVVGAVELAGMDVVEVAPPFDVSEITAAVAHRCVMEAISLLTGEQRTDNPACVAPSLIVMGIRLNDWATEEQRQTLKAFVARLIGTAGDDAAEDRRKYLCIDAAVREFAPLWLERAGLTEWARRLRGLPEIVDKAGARGAYEQAYAATHAANAANPAHATYVATYAANAAYAAANATHAAHAANAATHAANAANAANAATYAEMGIWRACPRSLRSDDPGGRNPAGDRGRGGPYGRGSGSAGGRAMTARISGARRRDRNGGHAEGAPMKWRRQTITRITTNPARGMTRLPFFSPFRWIRF